MLASLNRYKNKITLFAGISIGLGLLLNGFGMEGFGNVFLIIATIVASVPIFSKAYLALKMNVFSIELLVSIAVIGAVFIGEYVESSVVTFLFLFGDFLETRTLEKTRSSIKDLTEMAPEEATIRKNGEEITLDIEDVKVGDQVIIRSGGKVPVDGTIIKGTAELNEAAITGESVPVSKTITDEIFSGTIVEAGYIELIAEKVGEETTFSRIIELVEEAQESKTKAEKFLNKFANIYTPAVVGLAILVFLFTREIHLAITFLVIACPGALVIGAPVSTVAGIGNGAKNGVLIKGGEVMDKFSKVDTFVFDKTGTLTKGKPEVTSIEVLDTVSEKEIVELVASAETLSEHHIGRTIVKEAKKRKMTISEPESGEVIKGNGVVAVVHKQYLVIGNRKLMKNKEIGIAKKYQELAIAKEKEGNTAVFVAVNSRLVGIIAIADQIRGDAKDAIQELRNNGVKKIIMLTGDNQHTARAVSEQLGLDSFEAELLPEGKVNRIKELKEKGNRVAMAGDGINDAPAIATADIGLAMGEGGTAISMETADVVLMADKLKQLSHAYALSKKTMNNMKQNIAIAIGVVSILLIGVLMGTVHLASGMFIHEASVLIVILNGMRLINFKKKSLKKDKKREFVTV